MNSSRRKSKTLNAHTRNAPPPAYCCNNIARNITVALLQWEGEGCEMKHVSNPPVTERRVFRRIAVKERASFVLHLQKYNRRPEQRHPCLILDSSHNGFRLRGPVRLRLGQIVDIILGEDTVKIGRAHV